MFHSHTPCSMSSCWPTNITETHLLSTDRNSSKQSTYLPAPLILLPPHDPPLPPHTLAILLMRPASQMEAMLHATLVTNKRAPEIYLVLYLCQGLTQPQNGRLPRSSLITEQWVIHLVTPGHKAHITEGRFLETASPKAQVDSCSWLTNPP